MKKTTLKRKIFIGNFITILIMFLAILVAFNISINIYMEKETFEDLHDVSTEFEQLVSKNSPVSFNNIENKRLQNLLPVHTLNQSITLGDIEYYLINKNMKFIQVSEDNNREALPELEKIVTKEISKWNGINKEPMQFTFELNDVKYAAILMKFDNNEKSLVNWILISSSLENISEIQNSINIILIVILLSATILTIIISFYLAQKISKPISIISEQVKKIANKNFDIKINLQGNDEITKLSQNINNMTQKLAKHDNAQKTFFQNASHELRTPLMSIQGYAEGIKYNVVSNDGEAIETIITETKRLNNLVDDILYLSKIENIDDVYKFINVNLNDLMNNSIKNLTGIGLKKEVDIEYTPTTSNLEIYADQYYLAKAITNVMSNSIRYAKKKVNISCSINQKYVNIIINDDGEGINQEDLPHIFERFYKGKGGKFGLGLTIAKSIIEKHNGIIYAENTDIGAKFIIKLPLIYYHQ